MVSAHLLVNTEAGHGLGKHFTDVSMPEFEEMMKVYSPPPAPQVEKMLIWMI